MSNAPGIRFIDTPDGFAALLGELGRPARLAIDTEAASYHRYSDRICLLQLSTATVTAVVDTLRVPDLGAFGALLIDPAVESVFHDADYDLRLLDRDHAVHVAKLFDTRVAAQLLGVLLVPATNLVGLAALLEKYEGITLDKKFQRADWSTRPLEPGMLEYAAADTHTLLPLRDLMERKLRELGRLEWAEEEFAISATVRWGERVAEEAYLKVKGARLLKPRARSPFPRPNCRGSSGLGDRPRIRRSTRDSIGSRWSGTWRPNDSGSNRGCCVRTGRSKGSRGASRRP